jgi:hypothetical protein
VRSGKGESHSHQHYGPQPCELRNPLHIESPDSEWSDTPAYTDAMPVESLG